jgi:hypothetical protein
MAYYKYPRFLIQEQGAEFDATHAPGQLTPHSGIYRCEGCGLSATSVHQYPLPPQSHHPHGVNQGPIRWRLVVKSDFDH